MKIQLTPHTENTPLLTTNTYTSGYQISVRDLKYKILQQLDQPHSFNLVLRRNNEELLDSDVLSDPNIILTYHIQFFG